MAHNVGKNLTQSATEKTCKIVVSELSIVDSITNKEYKYINCVERLHPTLALRLFSLEIYMNKIYSNALVRDNYCINNTWGSLHPNPVFSRVYFRNYFKLLLRALTLHIFLFEYAKFSCF